MRQATRDVLLLLALSGALLLPLLGGVPLFDWDEINFAEIAREMIALGDYRRVHVNYELFWEKPPLFFWMQAAAMHLFGVGEYAARFPNAVAGMLTAALLYLLGRRLADRTLGWFWALAWLGSFLPQLYGKSGILDPWFNLFMWGSVLAMIRYTWQVEGLLESGRRGSLVSLLVAGLLSGLAVLTKGPVGWLLPALTAGAYVLIRGGRLWRHLPALVVWTLLTVGVCALWFVPEWLSSGPWFTREFLLYQWRLLSTEDAGHGGFPGYHFVVVLLGCFPASLFALPALRVRESTDRRLGDFQLWMLLLLAVVLVVFSAVQSKIVHYSSLSYYPLTFLAALTLHRYHTQRSRLPEWLGRAVLGASLLFCALLAAGLWALSHPERLAGHIRDPFSRAQFLEGPAWSPTDAWPLVLLLLLGASAFALLRKQRVRMAAWVVFGLGALFVQAALYTWVGRIEAFSQGTMIGWYRELSGQPVYVHSMFRSFAPYFYFRPEPPQQEDVRTAADPASGADHSAEQGAGGFQAERSLPPPSRSNAEARQLMYRRPDSNRDWLLYSEEVDRDVWVVGRIQQKEYLEGLEGLELVESRRGYVLFVRRKLQTGP